MKLLADENVHALVVAGLRSRGFHVEWLAATASSEADEQVLSRPDIGDWILLTYDRDFGDLIFNHGMKTPAAVIYSRLERLKPDLLIERIFEILGQQPLEGHLVVVAAEGNRYKSFVERTNG